MLHWSDPLHLFRMTQSENDFTRLLHQSQQLCAKISGTRSIPIIYRGLEQLEAFSAKLVAKAGLMSNEVRYTFFIIKMF